MDWCLSKHKSWFNWLLLIMMTIHILMARIIQGSCIEEERKALLEIKASLIDSYVSDADPLLPTWVDYGTDSGGECCDWERVECNTTTGHVINLSLENILGVVYEDYGRIWPLNVSLFLHFKELRSLNLSSDCLDNGIVSTGLKKLSSLKKLEILNLGSNRITNGIFPSLGALTSLKSLDLGDNELEGNFPAHEFAALENLEVLDLTYSSYYGTFQMHGFEEKSMLKKLKTLNLGYNYFNESLITSLSDFPWLEVLDLRYNPLSESFPARELAHLTNLKKLDLSTTGIKTIKGCKSLSRLKRLESISLRYNNFNRSFISCLSSLPSLKILDLSYSRSLGSSFPMQELSSLNDLEELDLSRCGLESLAYNVSVTMSTLVHLNLDGNRFNKDDVMWAMSAFPSLRFLSLAYCQIGGLLFAQELPLLPDLEVLLLKGNLFNGTLPMEALASFRHLEVLDMSENLFVGSIPSAIRTLFSLEVVSFANNVLNGSLPDHGFCQLKNLQELDLSQNEFDGNLPQCFNSLKSLKLFDISSNQFTGTLLPSLFANLTSLEYVDFSHNKFEGSLSFSSFSNHTKLEVVEFISDNDKFEVETEEPIGWVPMFQLKVFVLSNCNINRRKGSVVPSFLLHQHMLQILDLSHNSLEMQFPNWLINTNAKLEVVSLRNNSVGSTLRMPLYRNANTWYLDMSDNQITGTIPLDIGNIFPYITDLNLSRNSLNGPLPWSISDLSEIEFLDLSNNDFSGEVPERLLSDCTRLWALKLSNNRLYGEVLSRKVNNTQLSILLLDNNQFTGVLTNEITEVFLLKMLDISGNLFSGAVPGWISNLTSLTTVVIRNNMFEGQFPCGKATFMFLDISQNYFSGSIPSCLYMYSLKHLHLDSNRFIGSIPESFRNLTNLLTLDMGNNKLSGNIPDYLGELSSLRILVLRKNNFTGSIPKNLCQLSYLRLLDLSINFLSGSIPNCLQNITQSSQLAFFITTILRNPKDSFYEYESVLVRSFEIHGQDEINEKQDEVQFLTKSRPDTYKGGILDYMSGLDLSCNDLTGEIPKELGMLVQIHAVNLSHNQLTGPIPSSFSNLVNIESLDISSNRLSGKVPSELIGLNNLAIFIVANNNLSGRLPELKGQFGTFTANSYEGNPFLCGPPLEKRCATAKTNSTLMVPEEKWYDVDMVFFGSSLFSTWSVFLMGFFGLLYVNPNWRRRWFVFVEECLYTCYYFLCDCFCKRRF